MKLNTKKKPDLTIIQNRHFSVSEMRSALRGLELGIDNKEFKRLWDEEVVTPPDIMEPNYIGWKYNSAIDLIEQHYYLRGKSDEFEPQVVDGALMKQKELMRHKLESVNRFVRVHRQAKKEKQRREEAENAGDLDV